MKIREGFISNSSSTSFCIVGINSYNKDVKNKTISLNKEFNCKTDLEENGFSFYSNSDYGMEYLGKSISEMNENETLGQFKESVKKELINAIPELGKDIEVDIMIDGWYNG
jgi:hypothetical protein